MSSSQWIAMAGLGWASLGPSLIPSSKERYYSLKTLNASFGISCPAKTCTMLVNRMHFGSQNGARFARRSGGQQSDAMRTASLALLILIVAGCARVNRWRGDFCGVARTTQFEGYEGTRETGVVLHINRAEHLRAIGHDSKYLPTADFSAVLLKRANRLVDPNSIPTNIELVVTGTLDISTPRSSRGESLRQVGIPADAFKPSLRVTGIRPVDPTSSFKSKGKTEKR